MEKNLHCTPSCSIKPVAASIYRKLLIPKLLWSKMFQFFCQKAKYSQQRMDVNGSSFKESFFPYHQICIAPRGVLFLFFKKKHNIENLCRILSLCTNQQFINPFIPLKNKWFFFNLPHITEFLVIPLYWKLQMFHMWMCV